MSIVAIAAERARANPMGKTVMDNGRDSRGLHIGVLIALAVMKEGAMSSLPTRGEVDEFLTENDPELLAEFRRMPGG